MSSFGNCALIDGSCDLIQNVVQVKQNKWKRYSASIEWIFIEANFNLPCWSWDVISARNDIELLLLRHPEFPWNWNELSENLSIPDEFIVKHPSDPYKWMWDIVSQRISLKVVKDNPNLPWSWNWLSYRVDLNEDIGFIKENISMPWNWTLLSFSCTEKMIKDNPTLPWVSSVVRHEHILSLREFF